MLDLFADAEPWQEPLAPGAVILRRFALRHAAALLAGIEEVTAVGQFAVSPYGDAGRLHHVGGHGQLRRTGLGDKRAWVSVCSKRSRTPAQPWPQMPAAFQALCHEAAVAADYPDFRPDACLINRYARRCEALAASGQG